MNLVVNASHAMPDGGIVEISTGLASHPMPGAEGVGAFVYVEVADTGHGMPPDVLARAPEPFFTTKDVGKGSGLGLSQVYGFLAQSGGLVQIASEVGVGTTVRLLFPVAR